MTVTQYGTSYAAFCPIHWPELEDCDASCTTVVHAARAARRALKQYWYDVARTRSCLDCGAHIKRSSQRCNSCDRYRRHRTRKSVAA